MIEIMVKTKNGLKKKKTNNERVHELAEEKK